MHVFIKYVNYFKIYYIYIKLIEYYSDIITVMKYFIFTLFLLFITSTNTFSQDWSIQSSRRNTQLTKNGITRMKKEQQLIRNNLAKHKLIGIASYYGKAFQNRTTANGESFNMNDYTAAHKTLPFNSIVKVINLSNQRSTTVRINDRGPFLKGRIIDLSQKAAEDINMIPNGTAVVKLEIIEIGEEKAKVPVKKTTTTIVERNPVVIKNSISKPIFNKNPQRAQQTQASQTAQPLYVLPFYTTQPIYTTTQSVAPITTNPIYTTAQATPYTTTQSVAPITTNPIYTTAQATPYTTTQSVAPITTNPIYTTAQATPYTTTQSVAPYTANPIYTTAQATPYTTMQPSYTSSEENVSSPPKTTVYIPDNTPNTVTVQRTPLYPKEIQVASYSRANGAREIANKLSYYGISSKIEKNGPFYRVIVPTTSESIDNIKLRLYDLGFTNILIRYYN